MQTVFTKIQIVLTILGEPDNDNIRPVVQRAFLYLGDREVFVMVQDTIAEFRKWKLSHLKDSTKKTNCMSIFLRKLEQYPKPLRMLIFKGPPS